MSRDDDEPSRETPDLLEGTGKVPPAASIARPERLLSSPGIVGRRKDEARGETAAGEPFVDAGDGSTADRHFNTTGLSGLWDELSKIVLPGLVPSCIESSL